MERIPATERSQQFLDFVYRIKSKLQSSNEYNDTTHCYGHQQQVRDMAKIVTLLESALSDKRRVLKEKEVIAHDVTIPWDQLEEVSCNTAKTTEKYEYMNMVPCLHDLVRLVEEHFHVESQLFDEVLNGVSSRDTHDCSCAWEEDSLFDSRCLLEARNCVNYCEYMKSIHKAKVTKLEKGTASQTQMPEHPDLKPLRSRLQETMEKRLAIEKSIEYHRHELQTTKKLLYRLHRLDDAVAFLDRQTVRYEALRESIDSDRKVLGNLQRRATMIYQLVKNDFKTTNNIEQMLTGQGMTSGCSLSQNIDHECHDDVTLTLYEVLRTENIEPDDMPGLRMSKQALLLAAEDCKRSCNAFIHDIAKICDALDMFTQHYKANFVALINDCKKLDDEKNTENIQECIRQFGKHKSVATSLLSDLRLIKDTRYDLFCLFFW